ncbi:MAG: DUF692 domain-containing protein [Pseudomonadota bacterium]
MSHISPSSIHGVGIGLRTPHIHQLIAQPGSVPWLEILSDNFIHQSGLDLHLLDAICATYPVTLHGVNLSLGGTAPLDTDYLRALKQLAARTQAAWISEHACFCHQEALQSHDLLPLPYTADTANHLAGRIRQAQDILGQRILIENVSAYLTYTCSEMSEGEFLAEVLQQADCDLLLDVNNLYVNERNLGTSPQDFIRTIPRERVREIHLAGFSDQGNILIDAHNNPVTEPVWALYQQVLQDFPDTPTLIEWDNDIPPLPTLLAQAARAADLLQQNDPA